MAEEHEAALVLVAATSASGHPWGRDPRTLLLAEGWLDLLPAARPMGILRHPSPAAASPKARFRTPREEAVALRAACNRRLLALHDRTPFPILGFDEPGGAPRARLVAPPPSWASRFLPSPSPTPNCATATPRARLARRSATSGRLRGRDDEACAGPGPASERALSLRPARRRPCRSSW